MRRTAAAAFPVVLAALFVMVVASATGTAAGKEMTELRSLIGPGEEAPAFTLKTLDGKTVVFRPGGGKPSLVVFWSAFCPLCRELTPAINDVARRHGSRIRLASVNLDGKRFTNAVQSFVKENGIRYPILLDSLRGDFFIASDPYGVAKTPTAVLVDDSGKVHSAYAAEEMKKLFANPDEIMTLLKKGHAVKK
jgi:thiol-disulfide isomerase/thioredoxin